MSYSTRRGGGFGGNQQQTNVGNVGQRRPVMTNNFVGGNQLSPQQKGPGQIQQQAQRGQQSAAQNNTKNSQQQVKPQQNVQQQTQQQQQNQQQLELAVVKNECVENGSQQVDTSGDAKKPWMKTGVNKISRREKIRRRNVRLSKILQPKNAVMIFNELTKNSAYNVEDLPTRPNGYQFRATIVYDGVEHEGYGGSKIQAKNSAAEAALRHFVKSKKMNEIKKDDEGNEKMDVTEDDSAPVPLPWQHVASFAIYKLFSSWGEDPNTIKIMPSNVGAISRSENKPAKKMPENAETINPLMLINQMMPQAKFEEVGKSGDPPNVTFSFRCVVDDQTFVGTGPNKKAAKKLAAFAACHKILGVQYPADVYVSTY